MGFPEERPFGREEIPGAGKLKKPLIFPEGGLNFSREFSNPEGI
jgi:hypothetical protein